MTFSANPDLKAATLLLRRTQVLMLYTPELLLVSVGCVTIHKGAVILEGTPWGCCSPLPDAAQCYYCAAAR